MYSLIAPEAESLKLIPLRGPDPAPFSTMTIFFFTFLKIGVQLLYNVVFVSAVQ